MKTFIFSTLAVSAIFAGSLGAQTINHARENQQDRIAQGIKSGELTPAEAAKVEGREARINHRIHRDRVANGGTLTKGEKRRIDHSQDQTSKEIYRLKHNKRGA